MADVKLEEKSFGIQSRTKAKKLPWAYLAFAAIFLGLNIAGLTTGLGAGILGDLPQGAILNGNVWQSIANGAYLLAQGTAVGAAIVAPAVAYAGIRNAITYGKYKNAQKFAYQKDLVREGVAYDKELQKTEAIVNSMLPSTTLGASYLEQALAYRQKYKETKNPFKKAAYREKYTLAEDVVRRSIVTLTNRLAELSKLQNRKWKKYNSVTGLQQMTTEEIASRKREMRMIQEYLWSILNKVDDTDPFVTTLIAQVKKHRIDKINKTTTMAGIYLVPDVADPTIAEQVNNALVQRKKVKDIVKALYNESENEIVATKTYVSENIARKIAHLGLTDIESSRVQARRSADEISNLQRQAEIIVGDMRLNLDASNTSLKNIKDVESNAYVIFDTLKRTLRNARNKKQGINKAYNQAVGLLREIGVTKEDAESACQRIVDLETEAMSAAEGAEKSRRKAQSNADKSANFAKKAKESAEEAYYHAGSAMDDADRAYRARVNTEKSRRKAQSNADKTSNVLATAQDIATQLQDALTSANNSKAEMQKAVKQAKDALAEIGVKVTVADSFIKSIVENLETSKTKTAEISGLRDKATTAADEAITGAKIVEGMTKTVRDRAAETEKYRREAQSNATKSKKDANAARKNNELSDAELEAIRKKGLTAADYAEVTGKIKGLAEEEYERTTTARKGAEEEYAKTKVSAGKVQDVLAEVGEMKTEVSRIASDVKNKYTRFVNYTYGVTEYIETLEDNKAKVEAVINQIKDLKEEGVQITGSLKTTLENAQKVAKVIDEQLASATLSAQNAEEQNQKATESAKKSRSHEQAVEQIRNRMSQLENSANQILSNIRKIAKEAKDIKKTDIAEHEKLTEALNTQITNLKIVINNYNTLKESGEIARGDLETLKQYIDDSKKEIETAKTNIKNAEESAQKSAENAQKNAELIESIANEMQKHYSKARGKYSSIEERLDNIEDKFFDGKIVSAELTALSQEISTLKDAIEKLKTSKVSQSQLRTLRDKIAETDKTLFNRVTGNDSVLDDLSEQLDNLTKKVEEIKTIKSNPQKLELKKSIKEILSWARLIYWAKKTKQTSIEWSSLSGATKFIYKSAEMECARPVLSAISYSSAKPVGAIFNEFVGLDYSDISKISTIDEAEMVLAEIKSAVNEYNNGHKI